VIYWYLSQLPHSQYPTVIGVISTQLAFKNLCNTAQKDPLPAGLFTAKLMHGSFGAEHVNKEAWDMSHK